MPETKASALTAAIDRAEELLDHSWVSDDTGVMLNASDLRILINAARG